MTMEWWHWAVLGFGLILAELAIPNFVLVWFGVGCLLVAALTWLVPSVGFIAQILVLIVSSGALIALWFRVFKPGLHKTRLGQADSDMVGQVAMLVEPVAPFKRGRVRFQRPFIGADTWDCISDEEIPAGERVKVISVEGSILKIGKS